MMIWAPLGRQIVLLVLVSMVTVTVRPAAPAAHTHQLDAPVPLQDPATAVPTQAVDDPRAGTGTAPTTRPPAVKLEVVWTVEGEPGQPRLPLAVAISAQGQLYLADGGSQRIAVFDPDGRVITAWGGEGSEVGQFRFRPAHRCDASGDSCAPELGGGVAVDQGGQVYVADYGNHRVQVFDSRGGFLASWGHAGQDAGQFWLPAGIAVDEAGRVYVADSGNHRVQVFDRTGRFLAEWGGLGAGAGRFGYPTGVALDGAGRVIIVEPRPRVQWFDEGGQRLGQWVPEPSAEERPDQVAVAADRQGQVYVTAAAGRVRKLDATGQVLARWGGDGPWDVRLTRPSGIAVDEDGAAYIADGDAGRLHKVQQLLPVVR